MVDLVPHRLDSTTLSHSTAPPCPAPERFRAQVRLPHHTLPERQLEQDFSVNRFGGASAGSVHLDVVHGAEQPAPFLNRLPVDDRGRYARWSWVWSPPGWCCSSSSTARRTRPTSTSTPSTAVIGPQVCLSGFPRAGSGPERGQQFLLNHATEHGNWVLHTPDDSLSLTNLGVLLRSQQVGATRLTGPRSHWRAVGNAGTVATEGRGSGTARCMPRGKGGGGSVTGGGVAADGVHVDAESGGVLDEVLAVAAVDPGFTNGGRPTCVTQCRRQA